MWYQGIREHENLYTVLRKRENNLVDHFTLQRRLHANRALINRIEQSAVFDEHEGCVNCLEFSPDGSLLASGSDDFHVMLWDPYRKTRVTKLRTNHVGNLFSVKFMPQHGNNRIVTGAADKCIYMYDVNRSHDPILCCTCHMMRVKRLATAPDSPDVFWSSSEDGTILQIDVREKHICRSANNRVRLFNLGVHCYSAAEAKCIAINPRRTELMAVGASDPYARIYDRRMLRLTSSSVPTGNTVFRPEDVRGHASPNCVTYYCPGHISVKNSHVIDHESRAITYLTFNAAGTELLVNIGGEHIYLYDIQNAKPPEFLNLPEYRPPTPNIELEVPYCLSSPVTTASTTATSTLDAATGTGLGLGLEITGTENSFGCESDLNKDGVSRDDYESHEGHKGICEDSSDSGRTSKRIGKSSSTATKNGSNGTKRKKLPDHIEQFKRLGNEHCQNQKYFQAIEKYSEAIALFPQSEVLYLNRATAFMRRLWYGDVYEALRDCHQALRLDPSYTKAHFRLTRALLELGRPADAEKCLKELISRFPTYEVNHGVQVLAKDIKECPQTVPNLAPAGGPEMFLCHRISNDEFNYRAAAKDYLKRFVGHCNTRTDIKEANFFGYDGAFIVAGSDDGNFYLWDRASTKIQGAYGADSTIVNCVQVHPEICMLATSGIDKEVRLWEPTTDPDNILSLSLLTSFDKYIEDNQVKMRNDPFDLNSRNSFCWSN